MSNKFAGKESHLKSELTVDTNICIQQKVTMSDNHRNNKRNGVAEHNTKEGEVWCERERGEGERRGDNIDVGRRSADQTTFAMMRSSEWRWCDLRELISGVREGSQSSLRQTLILHQMIWQITWYHNKDIYMYRLYLNSWFDTTILSGVNFWVRKS